MCAQCRAGSGGKDAMLVSADRYTHPVWSVQLLASSVERGPSFHITMFPRIAASPDVGFQSFLQCFGKATCLRTVLLVFRRGSRLFGQASKARCYRSAGGSKDLTKCDNRVYRYSDAATMFASINDR